MIRKVAPQPVESAITAFARPNLPRFDSSQSTASIRRPCCCVSGTNFPSERLILSRARFSSRARNPSVA